MPATPDEHLKGMAPVLTLTCGLQEMNIPQLTGVEALLMQQGHAYEKAAPTQNGSLSGNAQKGDMSWLFDSADD